MSVEVMDDGRVSFLHFTFNRKLRTLQRSEETIQLRKKEADVLALLCDKFPNPVSQNDFLAEVWGGSYVTSQSIAQVIRSLRLILCDEKKNIILTIPKLGYKLAATPSYAEPVVTRHRYDEVMDMNHNQNGSRGLAPSMSHILASYINPMPLISFVQTKHKGSALKKLIFLSAMVLFGSLAFLTLSYDSCTIGFNKEKCEADLSVNKQYSPVMKEDYYPASDDDGKEYRLP